MKMYNLSHQLLKFFPGTPSQGSNLASEEELLHSLIEEQFKIQGTLENNRNVKRKKPFNKVNAEPDSDEELKQQLLNAVKQYKNNKRQDSFEENDFMNSVSLRSNSKKSSKPRKTESTSTQAKENAERDKNLRSIENLTLGESERNTNYKSETNLSAISDVKELINYFFLKKSDEVENTEIKKYKEYEKQGAIPKRFVKENLTENSLKGTAKNERLNSREKSNERDHKNVQKGSSSDHSYPKNKTPLHRTNFSEGGSDESVVKLSEGTCSRPFFYIVPENPSPNFLLSPGSYYVVPKLPDSGSGHSIIVHPETTSRYKINMSENFETKDSQSNYTKGSSITNMNDLGKEVTQKSDSHLNIGPKDVKLTEVCNNLEGKNDTQKSYDKSPERANGKAIGAAVPMEEKREFETITGNIWELEDGSGACGVTSAVIESVALKSDSFGSNAEGNLFLEEDVLQSLAASVDLKKKIEDQFSRMLAALPESNTQELRDICEVFQGDEVQVSAYIEEAKRKDRTHQHLLNMQYIFPDADPNYLEKKIEDLGDDDDAINDLTLQLLDCKKYPKIENSHVDAERQRLWKIYVDNFNVSDYIRNVPNPKNFETDRVKNSQRKELDLEFLRSRYPLLSSDAIEKRYNTCHQNLIRVCRKFDELDYDLIRLANIKFKHKDFHEAFLKEICYIDNRTEINEYLDHLNTMKKLEEEEARLNDAFLCCPLCYNDELVTSEAVACADGDLFCKDCIKRYVSVKLGDGIYKFPCPSEGCEAFLTDAILEKLLPDAVLFNISKRQQAAEISNAKVEGLESCPFCDYVYIPNPEDKIFKCQNPSCLIETCRKCHEENHIPLHCEEVERPKDVEARKKIEESMTEKLLRTCPTCLKKFVKIDGCNRMSCTCGTVVCYYCRRKITDYSHFNGGLGKCPLYSPNEELHTTEVIQAGVQERDRILKENPDIRILYDPISNA